MAFNITCISIEIRNSDEIISINIALYCNHLLHHRNVFSQVRIIRAIFTNNYPKKWGDWHKRNAFYLSSKHEKLKASSPLGE